MERKQKGMNKHQKAMFQPGEHRLRRDDIEELLVLSQSDDAEERLEAAEHLCPCHVRTHIDAVQQAVFRMMEDPDVRVRSAAWHTLKGGGVPDAPALDGIFTRAVERLEEPSKMTRRFIEMFALPHVRGKAEVEFRRAQPRPSLWDDIKPTIQRLTATDTAAMRARGRKLLKELP